MTRDFGQKGAYIDAISAIDIALWDLAGKALGRPIAELLGGAFRSGIHAYATGCYYRGEDHLDYRKNLPALAKEAESYARAGFGIVKGKIGLLPIEQDIERLAAIRKAVGPDVKILIDANHAYNSGPLSDSAQNSRKSETSSGSRNPCPPRITRLRHAPQRFAHPHRRRRMRDHPLRLPGTLHPRLRHIAHPTSAPAAVSRNSRTSRRSHPPSAFP